MNIEKLNDSKIASCSNDETIRIWDLNTNQCLNIFKNQRDCYFMLYISEKTMLSGSFG